VRMSELGPEHDPNQADEEYLADAYAALDDDLRQQNAESATETRDADISTAAADTDREEQTWQPRTAMTAPTEPGQQPVETAATDTTADPSAGPIRRVFLIDNKEYPDPDPDLPITGTRSVQAMYRDYFPGQLVEQAIGPRGAVRLDYVPPAAQLNLAEAQLAARVRLIELAVGELRRLRPSA